MICYRIETLYRQILKYFHHHFRPALRTVKTKSVHPESSSNKKHFYKKTWTSCLCVFWRLWVVYSFTVRAVQTFSSCRSEPSNKCWWFPGQSLSLQVLTESVTCQQLVLQKQSTSFSLEKFSTGMQRGCPPPHVCDKQLHRFKKQ